MAPIGKLSCGGGGRRSYRCSINVPSRCDDDDGGNRCFHLLRCLSRVAACIPELMKLDLDARSTAAYGLTHILCALTVTNRELRAKALADKDITPEQFDQLSELQRIKTKDEEGNVIEEKKVEREQLDS